MGDTPTPPPSLLLRHISRRYSEREVLAEAEPIFPNTIAARDFDKSQATSMQFNTIGKILKALQT